MSNTDEVLPLKLGPQHQSWVYFRQHNASNLENYKYIHVVLLEDFSPF